MAQLLKAIVVGAVSLGIAAGVLFFDRAHAQVDEEQIVCAPFSADTSTDESRAFIQAAQGYLTGRFDINDMANCQNAKLLSFTSTDLGSDVLPTVYTDLLSDAVGQDGVAVLFARDIRLLLRLNLDCGSDWECANQTVSRLIDAGLEPSQSPVFCGFDSLPAPSADLLEGLQTVRNATQLPFLCDELIGGTAVSNGWKRALSDYFDDRPRG